MKSIKIYYQIVTPESASNGDFDELGEHDTIEVENVVDALLAVRDYGYVEPSSSDFHSSIWYTTIDSVENYKTGAQTNYTIHLKGFSEFEQRAFYNQILKR